MAPLPTSVPVGVIGAGTMGSGIAQVVAQAGHPVVLHDAEPAAAARGKERIGQVLARAVERGRMTAAERDQVLARIDVASALAPLAGAGLVIEAIVEDLEIKRAVLAAVAALVTPDAILASNTSSISITALAAGLERPERVVGMHFFNPAPVMALVEIVHGLATAPNVAATVEATAEAWGKSPIACRSTPGFVVNRVARPFYGEALRALGEGAADAATIDALLREAGGFRMGPFQLIDLIGVDVNLAVSRSVHAAFYGDPRYTPSLIQEELVAAGRLGRKSGHGFYDHGSDAAVPEPATAAPEAAPATIMVEGDLGVAEPLVDRWRAAGIDVDRRWGEGLIRIGDLRLALTDGRGATEWAHRLEAPAALFDLALDFDHTGRLALAPADQTSAADRARAIGLLQAAGIAVSVIDDLPGMVVMRTVAMLANEAAEAAHTGVADAAAIDRAMRLGVNYPRGPLAWADMIGLERVRDVLDHLLRSYGDPRYRASWLLRRKAFAGGRFHG